MIHFYQRTNILTEEISLDNFFPFAEIVTIKALKVIASKNPALYYLYYDLLKDIRSDGKVEYTYSDAFDILQEVAYVLYQNIGKHFGDIVAKHNNKSLTLKDLCNRVVNQMTYQKKRYDSLIMPIIDNKDSEELAYEPNIDDIEEEYSKVDKLIESFNLQPIEIDILNCLMANMRHKDIIALLNCNHSRVFNVKYKLQNKLII